MEGGDTYTFSSVHRTNPAVYVVKHSQLFAAAYKLENEFARLEHAVNDPIFRRFWDELSSKKDAQSAAFQELINDTPLRRVGFGAPHDWHEESPERRSEWMAEQEPLSLLDLLKLRAIVRLSVEASQRNPSHDVIHVNDFDSVAVNNDPTKITDAPVFAVDGTEMGGEQSSLPAVYWTKRIAGYRSEYEPTLDHALIPGYARSAINKSRAIQGGMMSVVRASDNNIPCVPLYVLIGATWDAFSIAYDRMIGYRKVPKPLLEARERAVATRVKQEGAPTATLHATQESP